MKGEQKIMIKHIDIGEMLDNWDVHGSGRRYYEISGIELPVLEFSDGNSHPEHYLANVYACLDPHGNGLEYFQMTLGIQPDFELAHLDW